MWVKFLLIWGIGLFIEYFIVPFDRDYEEHLFNYFTISVIHVGIAAFVYLLYFWTLGKLVDTAHWNLWKELGAIFMLLFFIGSAEWGVRSWIYDNPRNLTFATWFEEITHGYLIGALLFFIILLITSHKAHHTQSTRKMDSSDDVRSAPVSIASDVVADMFEVVPEDIICIEADGNYTNFHIKNEDDVYVQMIRLSLKSIIRQLGNYPFLLKTHRGFIINTHFIQEAVGNAQGYQVSMQHLDFKVPVSRAHLTDFKSVALRSA